MVYFEFLPANEPLSIDRDSACHISCLPDFRGLIFIEMIVVFLAGLVSFFHVVLEPSEIHAYILLYAELPNTRTMTLHYIMLLN